MSGEVPTEVLHSAPRVDEDHSLLPRMQLRRDECGVLDRADVIEPQIRLTRTKRRRDHDAVALRPSAKPIEDLFRVADRRREPNPLHVAPAVAREPLEHRREVRAAVVVGERVNLVDDDLQSREQPMRRHAWAHKHRLERFRRRQNDIGRLVQKALLLGLRGIAVPLERTSPNRCRILVNTLLLVVQERISFATRRPTPRIAERRFSASERTSRIRIAEPRSSAFFARSERANSRPQRRRWAAVIRAISASVATRSSLSLGLPPVAGRMGETVSALHARRIDSALVNRSSGSRRKDLDRRLGRDVDTRTIGTPRANPRPDRIV